MKIGIDISQLAYPNTGVSNYLLNLVKALIEKNNEDEFVLFYSSLRNKLDRQNLKIKNGSNVKIKEFRLPPTFLDFLWNRLHILPVENFIGDIDVFITSDWTEPPAKKAKKVTILYDLIVYKYPEETHKKTEFNPFKLLISPNIVASQKRKLNWVKKETDKIFCISKATLEDANEILGIEKDRLEVVYPGI